MVFQTSQGEHCIFIRDYDKIVFEKQNKSQKATFTRSSGAGPGSRVRVPAPSSGAHPRAIEEAPSRAAKVRHRPAHILGGWMRYTRRFPKKPWEIMENHGFSLIFNGFCMKIHDLNFPMISQGYLGNLGPGVYLIQPSKICAGLEGSKMRRLDKQCVQVG